MPLAGTAAPATPQGDQESRGTRAGCQATVPEGFLAVRGASRDFVPVGLSRTDVLVMVIFRSEALRRDIYNDSKKRALFCLKLMWNPIAMCLFLLRGLGFFFKLHLCKGRTSGGGA